MREGSSIHANMHVSGDKILSNEMDYSFQCAICFADKTSAERIEMPCCDRADSSVKYCKACILTVAKMGINGLFGRCPTCSSYFAIKNGIVVGATGTMGQCRMCAQMCELADPRRAMCESCLGEDRTCKFVCVLVLVWGWLIWHLF